MAGFLDITAEPPGWPFTWGFGASDIVKEKLHDPGGLDTLGNLLVARVQSRTPVLKGGLIKDVTFEKETDVESDLLLTVFSDEEGQLDAWGRVYVEYQEGGTLGLPTYTNPPREMYAKVETEDTDVIELWGVQQLGDAVEDIAHAY